MPTLVTKALPVLTTVTVPTATPPARPCGPRGPCISCVTSTEKYLTTMSSSPGIPAGGASLNTMKLVDDVVPVLV